jgi:hypothetical protein
MPLSFSVYVDGRTAPSTQVFEDDQKETIVAAANVMLTDVLKFVPAFQIAADLYNVVWKVGTNRMVRVGRHGGRGKMADVGHIWLGWVWYGWMFERVACQGVCARWGGASVGGGFGGMEDGWCVVVMTCVA